jgi:predicted GIY-YIG superfamily endonuclease
LAEFDPTPSYILCIRNRKTNRLYYGYTNNLERRIVEHNKNGTWKLVYYEAYKAELDACNRERRLKHHAQALTALKTRLKESLK